MFSFAHRDTSKNTPCNQIFLNNLIRNADIFIAHFTRDGGFGTDVAVEVGVAAETTKPVLAHVEVESQHLNVLNNTLTKNLAFQEALTYFFNDFEDLAGYLKEYEEKHIPNN